MFFSLTAPAPPASPGPSSPVLGCALPRGRPCGLSSAPAAPAGPHARASPAELGPGPAAGEAAAALPVPAAWHCPPLCLPPPPACAPSRPAPSPAHRLLPADGPPCAHLGRPHLLGPWPLASGPARAQDAGHVLCASAARPTPLPTLGGEPGTVPGCLGAQPGQGELSGEGVHGGVRGRGRCQGRERAPGARRPPPGFWAARGPPASQSPEPHKGTDNASSLVKTVMCRSRQTNKSPYLFI